MTALFTKRRSFFEMKKRLLTIILVGVLALSGCSANEVLRIGTPTKDGAELHSETTNSEAITTFRTIIQQAEEIEEPTRLKDIADVVVFLNRPKEGIAEVNGYIWYEEDETAVLLRDPQYYMLDEKQTKLLKEIIVDDSVKKVE